MIHSRSPRRYASALASRHALRRAGIVFALVVLGVLLAVATLVDRRPPRVQWITVTRTTDDGRLAMTLATLSVEFSEPVEPDTVESRFRIEPAVAGTLSWDGDRRVIFTPDQKLPLATQFRVLVDEGFTDLQGNRSEGGPASYEFATVGPPSLAASAPASGDVAVPLEAPISLTFDRLMETQLTLDAVRIEPFVSVVPTWRGSTLVLTPTKQLSPGTRYQVRVGPEAVDTDGNSLAAPASVTFTTIATGLQVQLLQPADGSAGAPLTGPIAVVFDRPLDQASARTAIRLTPPATGSVQVVPLPSDEPGLVPGDEAQRSRVLVFTPDAPLAAHTTYTVEMSGESVRTVSGGAVADDRTWTFTTGGERGAIHNQIVFLSDRGGIQNVWAMNPDGTNARQLTAELAPVTSFDVSADGGSLLYASAGTIRRLTLPAGGVTTLTPPSLAEYAPLVLPDASAVVVGRRDRATGRDEGLWLRPLDDATGDGRRLIETGAPALGSSTHAGGLGGGIRADPWTRLAASSGDGQTLLLTDASGALVRLDLSTGARSPTGLRDPIGPPAWSATLGGFLVVATGEAGRSTGWVVPLAGSVTEGPSLGGWAAVGPEGSIAAVSAEPARLQYRSSLDATPFVLEPGDELLDRQPALSPSGDMVVFVRVRPEAADRSAGIWVVAPAAGEASLRRLSPTGSQPRWLP